MTKVRVMLCFKPEENGVSIDTFTVQLDENESLTDEIKADIMDSYFQNSKFPKETLVRQEFKIEA